MDFNATGCGGRGGGLGDCCVVVEVFDNKGAIGCGFGGSVEGMELCVAGGLEGCGTAEDCVAVGGDFAG